MRGNTFRLPLRSDGHLRPSCEGSSNSLSERQPNSILDLWNGPDYRSHHRHNGIFSTELRIRRLSHPCVQLAGQLGREIESKPKMLTALARPVLLAAESSDLGKRRFAKTWEGLEPPAEAAIGLLVSSPGSTRKPSRPSTTRLKATKLDDITGAPNT